MHKFKMKVEKCDNRVINKDYNTDFLYLLISKMYRRNIPTPSNTIQSATMFY
jgi:hypothetical protein